MSELVRRTYLAFYYYFCRTYLALSDIIYYVLLSFLSDKSSSVGHNYLAVFF